MANICKYCGSQSLSAGQCQDCHRDIGSVPKAIVAATFTSILLFTIWVGIAYFFQAEYSWVSILFGFIISASVAIFSEGRGPLFQLIATSFTIFTIFSSDLIVTWFLWGNFSFEFSQTFIYQLKELVKHHMLWDLYSWLFTFLGISSGFYIWKYE